MPPKRRRAGASPAAYAAYKRVLRAYAKYSFLLHARDQIPFSDTAARKKTHDAWVRAHNEFETAKQAAWPYGAEADADPELRLLLATKNMPMHRAVREFNRALVQPVKVARRTVKRAAAHLPVHEVPELVVEYMGVNPAFVRKGAKTRARNAVRRMTAIMEEAQAHPFTARTVKRTAVPRRDSKGRFISRR